jgi:Transglutaminase-like superfamily
MKNIFPAFVTGFSLLIASCTGDHLINNNVYREQVRKDYLARTIMAGSREKQLFSFQTKNLSAQQKEAMQFLFAYMPLSDLADYDGDFFLENANIALRTRKERPWGKSVPENIFLHYILPVRVNNENLDRFRIEYYNEISSRISGLDAKTAALEINHWCHEKVAYQPSDDRTSAPMSTILSSRGRCGEESTFTVVALRSAGLPARQVYTPRWAHSDDNHAWVEVWIDGNWHYMGACEPEPVLDRGWFTEPARRTMLIHTKSFGAPCGKTNVISGHRNYSLINILSRYAVTKKVYVKTLDPSGKPAAGTDVEFQLYNYSEFYPLAVVRTGADGMCHFETGLGDLVIWAHRGNDFNYRKITVNSTDTLTLVLDRKPEEKGYYEYDLGVPVARSPYEGPGPELVTKNNERLDSENRIRKAYTEKWMTPGEAVTLAVSKGADTAAVKDIISRSMGNYKEISSFISGTGAGDIALSVKLLTLIADKDLRDTKETVLRDHLTNCIRYDKVHQGCDEKVYYDYILNPRIADELIVPWRGYLKKMLPENFHADAPKDPEILVRYVREQITINDTDNYYLTPVSPAGVYNLKIADSFSRDIYFVAICRTLGIPARLEPGSKRPQYFSAGTWHDVFFNGENSSSGLRGYLKLVSSEKQPEPEYYIHFTIARFENGKYNTLEYDYNKKITDFRDELALSPGYYMLVTGNRVNDSRILSSVTFFELRKNEHRKIEVKLQKAR